MIASAEMELSSVTSDEECDDVMVEENKTHQQNDDVPRFN